MADTVSLATNPYGWLKGTGGTISPFTGQGAWSQVIGLPSATGGRNVISGLPVTNSLEFAYSGDVADAQALSRIWRLNPAGVVQSPQPYLTVYQGEFKLTFGSTVFTGGILGSGNHYFAHTIEVVDDATITPPGVRFSGMIAPAAQAMAAMLFDAMGGAVFVVETQNITGGTNACPIWRPV